MATLTAAELRNLGKDELLSKLGEAKEELFNLRFQAATGQLESHGRLRAVRKDIAREAMRRAMHKLPMKCRFIVREAGEI
jgi:ribosomal protein L29